MRYALKPLHCRPWLLQGLGKADREPLRKQLRRRPAAAQRHYGAAEAADFPKMPGFVLNGLKREELVALNSVTLHELYFAQPRRGRARPAPSQSADARFRLGRSLARRSSRRWGKRSAAARAGCS